MLFIKFVCDHKHLLISYHFYSCLPALSTAEPSRLNRRFSYAQMLFHWSKTASMKWHAQLQVNMTTPPQTHSAYRGKHHSLRLLHHSCCHPPITQSSRLPFNPLHPPPACQSPDSGEDLSVTARRTTRAHLHASISQTRTRLELKHTAAFTAG